jgi:excisionase family DNA binding protein
MHTFTQALISAKQASGALGITLSTLYRWTRLCGAPYYRAGRTLRFDLSELRAWMRSGAGAKRKGFTLQALAKKAGGMSYAFLSKVENGKADPSLETLKRLAKALKVKVAELVADE